MNGNWLTKTKKAYVYRNRKPWTPARGFMWRLGMWDEGWWLTVLHGDNDTESFWYPTWDLAMRAIPDLWRH